MKSVVQLGKFGLQLNEALRRGNGFGNGLKFDDAHRHDTTLRRRPRHGLVQQ